MRKVDQGDGIADHNNDHLRDPERMWQLTAGAHLAMTSVGDCSEEMLGSVLSDFAASFDRVEIGTSTPEA